MQPPLKSFPTQVKCVSETEKDYFPPIMRMFQSRCVKTVRTAYSYMLSVVSLQCQFSVTGVSGVHLVPLIIVSAVSIQCHSVSSVTSVSSVSVVSIQCQPSLLTDVCWSVCWWLVTSPSTALEERVFSGVRDLLLHLLASQEGLCVCVRVCVRVCMCVTV